MPERTDGLCRGSTRAPTHGLMTTVPAIDEALEQAHRLYFGRLVGWLFRRTQDLQRSEDAVATAFASAVSSWRESGVPRSPEAWLRVAARNAVVSDLRLAARSHPSPPETFETVEAAEPAPVGMDERLGLLFVCAHPALDARIHAPLMMQAVLGIDAARIASAFLTPPATMGQRLARAKTKIRDAGIRYRVPDAADLPARLGPVLQAIYASYGVGDPIASEDREQDRDLRAEAIRLARVLMSELPDQPECAGLLALLLHTESRREGRMLDGRFVPLGEQDTRKWSTPLRLEADGLLRRAADLKRMGRFQLEAAISSTHSARADGKATDWAAISALYGGLLALAPSVGATVGAASALVETGESDRALDLLDSLPPSAVTNYQPYWVCRSHVLRALGASPEAHSAMARAVGLTSDPAVRSFLLGTAESL